MDRRGGPTMLAPPPIGIKPEGKRLRRKLQKIDSSQRKQQTNAKSNKPNKAEADSTVPRTLPALPSSLLPAPDLGDAKWFDYTRKSGYYSPPGAQSLQSLQAKDSSARQSRILVPELAHLALNDATPRKQSLDKSSESSLSASTTSLSSAARKRRAKTPVFAIGQLEGLSARDAGTTQKVSSVELIAEQYRALLASRNSFMTDSHSEPTPSMHDAHEELPVKAHQSADDLPTETFVDALERPSIEISSPRSDGTLVAFEEDAIYFKPVSFSPEPLSPIQDLDLSGGLQQQTTRASGQPGASPSLQICYDLLTRELSSAASGQPQRPSGETSALQVYVMIEAYEKMRDQVNDMNLDSEQWMAMNGMLDMWLRTLYTIHDKMTGNDGQASESVYDDSYETESRA